MEFVCLYNHSCDRMITVALMVGVDPFTILGLERTATVSEIDAARRFLAKSAHPDHGGSVVEMQRINAAAQAARALAVVRSPVDSVVQVSQDHPSFTIEALPVRAFEALLIVADLLGELIDDDPPYQLEVLLDQPLPCWCRLSIVPDAGASTVSIEIGNQPGDPAIDIDSVRDAWIVALNSLDWNALD
jgi:hypothetical protein